MNGQCELCQILTKHPNEPIKVYGLDGMGNPDHSKVWEVIFKGSLDRNVPVGKNAVCALEYLLDSFTGNGESGAGCRRKGCRAVFEIRRASPATDGQTPIAQSF